ncbi:MAG: cell division topological specificity factor MinE [Bacillota bacterium]|nr:cell division topological specificity factor MinE [Bacillota bacterium]
MDFLSKLFSRETSSRSQANDRLRVVLTHDRMGASSQILETLKEEIIAVICSHVEVEGNPEVNFVTEGRHSALDISVPLRGR